MFNTNFEYKSPYGFGLLTLPQNPFSLGSSLPTPTQTVPLSDNTGGGTTPYLKQDFKGRINNITQNLNKSGITDKGVNLIANLVTQGADMAQGALENGVTNSKGYDTFKQIGNMKTGNAVIDAGKAVAMMGISAMNRWGGQESDEFYVDRLLQETMGGSYTDSFKDLNEAEQGNGFYGMFSLGKKKKQDANVAKQEEIQSQLQDINEEAQALYASANNVQANNIKYLNKINGIDFSEFSLVAKNGIKLEHLSRVKLLKNKHFINLDTKRVEEFKQGGVIEQSTIEYEFVPIIVEPVKYFKNGGTLIDEWMPVVVDSIEIFKDGGKSNKKFPQEYIDFINSVKLVAPNLGELEPEGYNMYRYWELNGKPKNWDEALQKEMFHEQKDGYHAHSVAWNENGEGEWMKHKTFPTAWMEKAFYDGYEFLTDPETGEPLFLDRMPEYEGVHPILIPLRGEQAEESKKFRETYDLVEDENGNRKYILRKTEKHKEGGSIKESDILVKLEETNLKNVIPEGALHKNKHHIENTEGLTLKGIPVIDNDGEQQAEIELNEIIFTLEVTKKLEELHKKYKEGNEQAAVEAGKLLVLEILYNTDDRTGLIAKCLKGGTL